MALTFKNVAIGCAVGCGVLVLFAVGSCVGFAVWVNRPGELLEASRMVDADTTGYAEWTLRGDDPGVRHVVEDLLAGLDRLQRESPSGPPLIETFLRRNQSRQNRQAFEEFLPSVVAWTAWSDPEAPEPLSAVSISIEKLGNRVVVMDWLFGFAFGRTEDVEVVRHAGEKIYSLPDSDVAFFLRPATVLIAADVDTAARIVDRLNGSAAGGGERSDLQALLDTLPADAPLRGAVVNRDGEAAWAMEWLLADDDDDETIDWARVAGLTLSGGVRPEGALEARFSIVGRSAWSDVERGLIERRLVDALGGEHLQARAVPPASPGRVEVALRIDDLSETFGRLIRSADEEP